MTTLRERAEKCYYELLPRGMSVNDEIDIIERHLNEACEEAVKKDRFRIAELVDECLINGDSRRSIIEGIERGDIVVGEERCTCQTGFNPECEAHRPKNSSVQGGGK